MCKTLAFAGLLALAPLAPSAGDERAAIERAVLDYAESYYEARPEYIERSVDGELSKLGFERRDDGGWEERPMTYQQLHAMVVRIRDGDWKPEPGPKQVEILDALDQTALVKLTAVWGVDYMQLVKQDGKWKTRHVLWQSPPASRNDDAHQRDRRAVEAAVRDYLEALYEVEPERIERSVDPGLVKYGYWREQASDEYRGMAMTYEQLHELAGRWNADGKLPADAPREIEVLDVMDQIACAKLTAQWGIDTMLLARKDGTWKILKVMWQSHPAG